VIKKLTINQTLSKTDVQPKTSKYKSAAPRNLSLSGTTPEIPV
jgi:hypothetical protein